ncbi:hypothetical protein HZF05_16375 [Sphingomonas sp. CGMCC 1.13654]|uniref:Uncharacterized protein n=1 Tax=Sphingomonas chungangi TaxID=2683589 RepID=A0A838L8N1_9SPHN|nr:hypothetical protein [Sphingomonas chungangi]MBA2935661.1 hypothetical protein [Sphingomonas chungangi]MVW54352.1 hypothetical protein [Sphingomonas chungangi]
MAGRIQLARLLGIPLLLPREAARLGAKRFRADDHPVLAHEDGDLVAGRLARETISVDDHVVALARSDRRPERDRAIGIDAIEIVVDPVDLDGVATLQRQVPAGVHRITA